MSERHATRGRLTNKQHRCPSCAAGDHSQHQDPFNHPDFGLIACSCRRAACNPKDTP